MVVEEEIDLPCWVGHKSSKIIQTCVVPYLAAFGESPHALYGMAASLGACFSADNEDL